MASHKSSSIIEKPSTEIVEESQQAPQVIIDGADGFHLPLRYAGGELGLTNVTEPRIQIVDAIGDRYRTSSVEWALRHLALFYPGKSQVQLLADAALHYGLAPWALMGADLSQATYDSVFGGGWTSVKAVLPDSETLVLLALNDDDVWPGYRDGDTWRYVDAMPIDVERVTHWMRMPPAPGAAS
jgi:hypothetical protein